MPSRSATPRLLSIIQATILLTACHAFAPSCSKREARSRPRPLHFAISDSTTATATADNSNNVPIKPHWVPWELAELAAEDMRISREEFVRTFTDVEVYTSCDDEGDDFHECDFFGQYLGPTKWLHLTNEARASVDDVHFSVWKDVWSRPHQAVDMADKVSNDCLRYYNEFMLEPRTSSIVCPTDRPLVRVKVVPASFGLDGFEDATWEATEDLIERSSSGSIKSNESNSAEEHYCRAITLVVAAPDLFTDPTIHTKEGVVGGMKSSSPQVEFEPDGFREFTSALRGKLVAFSKMEGVPLNDAIRLTPFHPLWRMSDGFATESGNGNDGVEFDGVSSGESFPYPCVAVSTKIDAI